MRAAVGTSGVDFQSVQSAPSAVGASFAVGVRRPGRDLCEIGDLDLDATCELLAAARALVPLAAGDGPRGRVALRGALILSLFNEPSTRTRLSFEVAARRLGAQVVDFQHDGASSAAKGETELDALHNLDAMGFDAAVVRDGRDGYPLWLCSQLRARVVNAGDGVHEHPTQALLDALTILEAFGREPVPGALDGLRVAICGDLRHGRVGRSNLRLLRTLGAELVIAGPGSLAPAELAREFGVGLAPDLDAALTGAHVAMMLRIQRERLPADLRLPDDASYHAAWGLTQARLGRLAPGGVVLHPGPMNRGVEIADEVADGPRSRILRQVTLGVAVRMAVLARACGVSAETCLKEQVV
ncbi:aspartate carbamoyltransferase catalytic subunit [Nannocystis sp.]|uniref:aspartate carbamoyltransferase catalytic subunit n=1 Tax=Nannocystis sp. TaxID=1962667 RepID=UPI002420C244|nr:aspartate carbamoyltransferase catalytic subunit [Nannocystis sp.]MBK7827811.1 aspartate carbamoyltransferase catalytic subunit [Nannocystis sp.]MBK9753851.1 aspartate carbamoyltransferase catalytic subunit [Nannocystis sp.]